MKFKTSHGVSRVEGGLRPVVRGLEWGEDIWIHRHGKSLSKWLRVPNGIISAELKLVYEGTAPIIMVSLRSRFNNDRSYMKVKEARGYLQQY